MEEFFKLTEYSKYSISKAGVIKNNNTNKILKQSFTTKGYLGVDLYKDSISKSVSVKTHRLVAETFLIKKIGMVIDHIDNNKCNNSVNNLQYVTNRYNVVKQKLYSSNGFLAERKCKIIVEYRQNNNKYYKAFTNKISAIIYYCSKFYIEDYSVVNLILNFYNLSDNTEIIERIKELSAS